MRKGDPVVFKIGSFGAGTDDEGETITVPIAQPTGLTSSLLAKVKITRSGREEGEARATEVLRIVRALRAKAPGQFHEVRDIGGTTGEAFKGVRGNPDSRRKAVRRALDAVTGDSKVEANGNSCFCAVLQIPAQDTTSRTDY